jgi:transposase, IS5 family
MKVLHRRTRETSETVQKIHHQARNETESVCRQTETFVEEDKEAKVSQRPATKRLEEIKQVNQQIVEITESVCRKAKVVVEKLKEKGVRALAQGQEKWKEALDQLEGKLTEAIGRTEILIHQTKQVISGNIIIPERIVSFFDPEARPIKKGKLSKKTEFGFKTRIDETESGFVTGYDVYEGNPSDEELLLPAVENHQTLFGEVPHAVATD